MTEEIKEVIRMTKTTKIVNFFFDETNQKSLFGEKNTKKKRSLFDRKIEDSVYVFTEKGVGYWIFERKIKPSRYFENNKLLKSVDI